MLVRSEIRFCPHCGAPYLFNWPISFMCRCRTCGKPLQRDPYSVNVDPLKIVRGVYKALKKTFSDVPPQYFMA